MTLIQDNAIRIIEDLIKKSELFSTKQNDGLENESVKGYLREIFVSDVLNFFLPHHLGIGSGIIINHKGQQSNQTDIIIYDKRILPPFIYGGGVGIYPAESVIATIEVKSYLRDSKAQELEEAEKSARKLHEEIYNKDGFDESCQGYIDGPSFLKPICAVIGLRQDDKLAISKKLLINNEESRNYLGGIKYLSVICHAKQYSWINFDRPEYSPPNYTGWKHDTGNALQETIRFIALIIDRTRTLSERRLDEFLNQHWDWVSIYTRKQRASLHLNKPPN